MKLLRNFRGRHSDKAYSVIDKRDDRIGFSYDLVGSYILRCHRRFDIVPGMSM